MFGVQPDPGFWTKTSWIQIGYGVWVNQALLTQGLAFGFSAVALPQLELPGSRIQPTLAHSAWIAGILTLTSPLGCIISGFLVDRIGRRYMMILCLAPISIGWLYTGFARTAVDMIIGRFITGIGVGMASAPSRTYCTEISLPNMRGVIGIIPSLAMGTGIFIQASMGSMLKWENLCYICGGYSLFLMLLNCLLPETPYFLLMKGHMRAARKSLRKVRGKNYPIDDEIDEMKEYKIANDIRSLSPRETIEFLMRPVCCKPFVIVMVYGLAAQLAGVTTLMFYTVEMLQDSKSSVDPYTGNILLSATRVCSCLAVSFLIFKMRRRTLALISAVGIGMTLLWIGIYVILYEGTSVLSQIAFMLYVLFGAFGYYSLPFLLLFEMIPLQVRGLLGGISISLLHLMVWASSTSYPFVRNAFGFPTTIILMAICSLLGGIYVLFYLPETKGLSLVDIEEYFNKKRKRLGHFRSRRSSSKSSQSRHKLTIVESVVSVPEDKQGELAQSRRKSSVTFSIDKTEMPVNTEDVNKNINNPPEKAPVIKEDSDVKNEPDVKKDPDIKKDSEDSKKDDK